MAGEGATPRAQALAIAEAMVGWNTGISVAAQEEYRDRTTTRTRQTLQNGVETSSSGSVSTRGSSRDGIDTSTGGNLTQAQQAAIHRATGYNLPRVDRHGNPIRYEFGSDTDSRHESAGGSISRNGVSVGGRGFMTYEGSRGGAWMVRQGVDPNTGLPYNVREPLTTRRSHELEGYFTVGGRHFSLPVIPGVTHRWTSEVHHPERLPDTRRPAPVSMPSRTQMLQQQRFDPWLP